MLFTTSLTIESWTLFALGVLVVICRLISRRIKLSNWKSLELDDYLMLFALANFTGVVVSINEVAKNGSNYMPPEVAAALDKAGVDQAVYGSIMTFVLEIFTLTATWTIKACLLLLYHRLTTGTHMFQVMAIKIAAGYCALTYVLVMVLFVFYWCHPTVEYWAVPVRIEQCATYYHHAIMATACNISSDIFLLCIPIPIIIKTQLPLKRKIILCCILGLGVFNILAAILNRYYNFSNPNSYVFLYWYVAEVGIAMYVGNLPHCWPLLRLALGHKEVSQPSYEGRYASGSRPRKSPATTWNVLDDDGIDGSGRDRHGSGSDSGSQIELVLQKGSEGAGPYGQAIDRSVRIAAGKKEGQTTPDKIVVVKTVDVTRQ